MPVSEDVKAYVDDATTHLRSVSLLLVTVCVALNALLVEGDPRRVSQATLMIEEIRQLRDSWSVSESAWLGDLVQDCGVAEFEQQAQNALVIGDRRDFLLSMSRNRGLTERYSFRLPKDVAVPMIWGEDQNPFSSFPNTLHEFQKWWDSWKEDRYLMVPFAFLDRTNGVDKDFGIPNAYVSAQITLDDYEADARAAEISFIPLKLPFPGKSLGCDSLYVYSSRGRFWKRPTITFSLRNSTQEVWIPILTSSIRRFNRTMLAKRFPDWKPSNYDTTFSTLKAETAGLENLTLDKAADRLKSHLDRLEREVEIGGVKFEMTDLPFWGTLVVLGLQLYLALNMQDLSVARGGGVPTRVSWLGVSQRWSSICFSLIALCILPCATLLRSATANRGRSLFCWLTFALSVIIASWSLALILVLRRLRLRYSER